MKPSTFCPVQYIASDSRQQQCYKSAAEETEFKKQSCKEMTLTFGSHKLKMFKYLFSFKLLSSFSFPQKKCHCCAEHICKAKQISYS